MPDRFPIDSPSAEDHSRVLCFLVAIRAAVEAGAEVLSPMTHTFGSREGRVLDPFGSTWTISTHEENVSVEEMQRRLNALAEYRDNQWIAERAAEALDRRPKARRELLLPAPLTVLYFPQ